MRSLADHIYDISYNSIKANAKTIKLKIERKTSEGIFVFKIEDSGSGIAADKLKMLFDPFYTTRDKKIRKVGLGLPLLKMNAEMTGGSVFLESELGKGTVLEAIFKTTSMNIPEYGDLAGTFAGLLAFDSKIEWEIEIVKDDERETLTTVELKEILGDDVAFNNAEIMHAVGNVFKDILEEIEFTK